MAGANPAQGLVWSSPRRQRKCRRYVFEMMGVIPRGQCCAAANCWHVDLADTMQCELCRVCDCAGLAVGRDLAARIPQAMRIVRDCLGLARELRASAATGRLGAGSFGLGNIPRRSVFPVRSSASRPRLSSSPPIFARATHSGQPHGQDTTRMRVSRSGSTRTRSTRGTRRWRSASARNNVWVSRTIESSLVPSDSAYRVVVG